MTKDPHFDQPLPKDPQPLVGFRTNDEWNALLAYVNGLVEEAESFADPEVKEKVFELLQGIDAIHREALTRLVRLFKKGVLEQVVTDPAIRSLMELYDLMPQKPGYGEIPDFVTGYPPRGSEPKDGETISEKALSDRVPIPHWVPALDKKDDLAPGELVNLLLDDRRVLLCRVGEKFFAVVAECAQDGGTMAGGSVNGYTLTCPLHEGCYYDVRQGARIGAPGNIKCFPVKLDDNGRVLVGFEIPFKPSLPSF